LYTAIPEIASTERHKPNDLSRLGEQYLLRFADLVQQLPSYSAEPRPLAPKERATKKLVLVGLWFFGLFSHENLGEIPELVAAHSKFCLNNSKS